MSLLIQNLSCCIEGRAILDGVSFHVASGEVLGLIGPNGSGKTSLINVVSGLYPAAGGSVTLDGRPLLGLRPYDIASAGLVRTFQIPRPFRRLTVRENMMVPLLQQRKVDDGEVAAMAGIVKLAHVLDLPAGNLSGGQKKLLELARAALAKPRVMLLDEPFAGVHPNLKVSIREFIRLQAKSGVSVLIVDHDLPNLFEMCGRVVVLSAGTKLLEGSPREVLQSQAVIEAYLGSDIA